MARVTAFQAVGCGFESRLPLLLNLHMMNHNYISLIWQLPGSPEPENGVAAFFMSSPCSSAGRAHPW